jgi:E3 ubiquitin-protein ligase SDIR1
MSTLAQQMAAMQRGGAPGAGPSSSVPPVTDEDMAVLPTFTYKRPATVTGEASQPSPSTSKEGATDAAGSQGAEQPAGNSNSSTPAARTSEAGSEGDMLTCPICIEAVEDGDEVLTLPCLHQFHSTCVSPWLKQQGRVQAKCPMCKTPVWQ